MRILNVQPIKLDGYEKDTYCINTDKFSIKIALKCFDKNAEFILNTFEFNKNILFRYLNNDNYLFIPRRYKSINYLHEPCYIISNKQKDADNYNKLFDYAIYSKSNQQYVNTVTIYLKIVEVIANDYLKEYPNYIKFKNEFIRALFDYFYF